ncbi:MAG: HAD-IB family hydrolase [Candidatus Saccharimonadales bacterium]
MSKPFAVFDIDGTIFRSGLYREAIYELLSAGKLPKSISNVFDPLEIKWKKRESDAAFNEYVHAMANAIDATLPQIRITDFEEATNRVYERVSDYVYVYTRGLVEDLKQKGYFLIAISGSQDELVKPFAEKYGFDVWIGQHYERGDEFYTGKIAKTHKGKDVILKKIMSENNLDFTDSYAVGDTRGDIEMLSLVDHPIAFNPDRGLFEAARQNKWKVVVERKNMIYELEPHGQSFILA